MTCVDYTAPSGAPLLTEQKSYTHHNRKLVCGIGINDYPAPINKGGIQLRSYSTWKDMLLRCYTPMFLTEHPTYLGCSVSPEWLYFSNFERWYEANYVEGYQLDKDVLLQGNKVYSKDCCVFIPQGLNKLLTSCNAKRGALPLGVCYNKRDRVYKSSISNPLTLKKVQSDHATPLEAHQAWQLAKALIIEQFPTNDPRIRKALDLRVAQLRDDHANNRITTKL